MRLGELNEAGFDVEALLRRFTPAKGAIDALVDLPPGDYQAFLATAILIYFEGKSLSADKFESDLLLSAKEAVGTHNRKTPNANVTRGHLFDLLTGPVKITGVSHRTVSIGRRTGSALNSALSAYMQFLSFEVIAHERRQSICELIARDEGFRSAMVEQGFRAEFVGNLAAICASRFQSDNTAPDRFQKQLFVRNGSDYLLTSPIQSEGFRFEVVKRLRSREGDWFPRLATSIAGANAINAGQLNAELGGKQLHFVGLPPVGKSRVDEEDDRWIELCLTTLKRGGSLFSKHSLSEKVLLDLQKSFANHAKNRHTKAQFERDALYQVRKVVNRLLIFRERISSDHLDDVMTSSSVPDCLKVYLAGSFKNDDVVALADLAFDHAIRAASVGTKKLILSNEFVLALKAQLIVALKQPIRFKRAKSDEYTAIVERRASDRPTRYLLIPNVKLADVNAEPSLHVVGVGGLPMSVCGFAESLRRQHPVMGAFESMSAAVLVHDYQLKAERDGFTFRHSQNRSTGYARGTVSDKIVNPPIVPEIKADAVISVIVQFTPVDGDLSSLIESLNKSKLGFRIAGGVATDVGEVSLLNSTEVHAYLRHKDLTGTVLIDRGDLLKSDDPDVDQLDLFLDALAISRDPLTKRYQRRVKGWLVPLFAGYQAIEKPVSRDGLRSQVPHFYSSEIFSLAECVRLPLRAGSFHSVFWSQQWCDESVAAYVTTQSR